MKKLVILISALMLLTACGSVDDKPGAENVTDVNVAVEEETAVDYVFEREDGSEGEFVQEDDHTYVSTDGALTVTVSEPVFEDNVLTYEYTLTNNTDRNINVEFYPYSSLVMNGQEYPERISTAEAKITRMKAGESCTERDGYKLDIDFDPSWTNPWKDEGGNEIALTFFINLKVGPEGSDKSVKYSLGKTLLESIV